MQMYVVEGGMGRLVMRAKSLRAACAAARRKYGTVNEPFKGKQVFETELREHLVGGAVFFEADFSIMDPCEAYPMAGLEIPHRFRACG